MTLTVLLPTGVLLQRQVAKVTAEAEDGHFCVLPHHIDFVAALVPGLLAFEPEEGKEQFLGVDEGIFVKCGMEVLVSTRKAVQSENLTELKGVIDKELETLGEREKKARAAASKLEADLVRGFLELGERV